MSIKQKLANMLFYAKRSGHKDTSAGEFFVCTICGGTRIYLPSHCPGRPLMREEMDKIQKGELNYKAGKWKGLGLARMLK